MKKIEELVYKGMVLDEHGVWIPMAEKLRKEREFLTHLEQGEILHRGSWVKLSSISHLTSKEPQDKVVDETLLDYDIKDNSAITEKTPPPEETVLLSTDMIGDNSENIISFEPQDEYPAETSIFSIEKSHESSSFSGASDGLMNRHNDSPDSKSNYQEVNTETSDLHAEIIVKAEPESELEETVIFNVETVRRLDRNDETDNGRESVSSSPQPSYDSPTENGLFSSRKNHGRKNIMFLAAALALFFFLLLIFLRFVL